MLMLIVLFPGPNFAAARSVHAPYLRRQAVAPPAGLFLYLYDYNHSKDLLKRQLNIYLKKSFRLKPHLLTTSMSHIKVMGKKINREIYPPYRCLYAVEHAPAGVLNNASAVIGLGLC